MVNTQPVTATQPLQNQSNACFLRSSPPEAKFTIIFHGLFFVYLTSSRFVGTQSRVLRYQGGLLVKFTICLKTTQTGVKVERGLGQIKNLIISSKKPHRTGNEM